MNGDKPRYWFPAKRFGWGWGPPVTWQGWAFLFVWLGVFLSCGVWLDLQNPILFYAFIALMCGTLISVCWAKGEPPKWRWGNRE